MNCTKSNVMKLIFLDVWKLLIHNVLQCRCSRHSDSLVATAGRPGNCLKVWHSKSGVMLVSSEMVLVGGMSWHSRIPYLAVGGDREVQMYKVQY